MRSHEDSSRYADPQAYERYADLDAQELVLSQLVVGSVGDVFDAWLASVWVANGSEVRPGAGRGLVGHVRQVPLGVQEEILSVGLPPPPEDDFARLSTSGGSRIPSVCYRLRAFGPFPLKDHLALVRFLDVAASPNSAPATLVIWTVKFVPSALGYVLCCGGLWLRLVFRTALQFFLSKFAADQRRKVHFTLE